MRNSDEIIRNLETAGITSFADFSTFMWNMRHNDDHTEELDRLQKEFTAIDKLTEKMKHRENSCLFIKNIGIYRAGSRNVSEREMRVILMILKKPMPISNGTFRIMIFPEMQIKSLNCRAYQ